MQRERFQDITKGMISGDSISISFDNLNEGIREVQLEVVDKILHTLQLNQIQIRKSSAEGKEWMMSALSLLKDDIENLKEDVYGK